MTDMAVGKPLPNIAGLRLADYLVKHNSALLDPEWQSGSSGNAVGWEETTCL